MSDTPHPSFSECLRTIAIAAETSELQAFIALGKQACELHEDMFDLMVMHYMTARQILNERAKAQTGKQVCQDRKDLPSGGGSA